MDIIVKLSKDFLVMFLVYGYKKRKSSPNTLLLNPSAALNFVVGEPTMRTTGITSSYSEFMTCKANKIT